MNGGYVWAAAGTLTLLAGVDLALLGVTGAPALGSVVGVCFTIAGVKWANSTQRS